METYRVTRIDKGANGKKYPQIIGYTEDYADAWCMVAEDRTKIDWEAQYLVQREGRILHRRLVKYRVP